MNSTLFILCCIVGDITNLCRVQSAATVAVLLLENVGYNQQGKLLLNATIEICGIT